MEELHLDGEGLSAGRGAAQVSARLTGGSPCISGFPFLVLLFLIYSNGGEGMPFLRWLEEFVVWTGTKFPE